MGWLCNLPVFNLVGGVRLYSLLQEALKKESILTKSPILFAAHNIQATSNAMSNSNAQHKSVVVGCVGVFGFVGCRVSKC